MNILILGIDGYIGHQLAVHLLRRGHRIMGVDNYSRRDRVIPGSLTPIASKIERKAYFRRTYGDFMDIVNVDLGVDGPTYIAQVIQGFIPDAIVHLAEQPSAPWSMQDVYHAFDTQYENVLGTLCILWAMKECSPKAHLVKLGTMGEYGTPECDIPEGRIPDGCIGWSGELEDCQRHCPMSGLLFPRTPGSFYHASKVMDTINIEFCCRNWGLRSTDIMQGVVFGLGLYTEDVEITRFDYDEYFGTVINRFCTQAIVGHPLTVYGRGEQIRGFLTLGDSIRCLTIALENPALEGEYRTLNQFEHTYTINQLANMTCIAAKELKLNPSIEHIPNPRNEAERHYYNPDHRTLFNLGYEPTTDIQGEIIKLIRQLLSYKDRVDQSVIMPETQWR